VRGLSAANDAKGISWISEVGEPQLGALFAAPLAIETKRSAIVKFVRAYQRGANDYAATLLRRNRYNKRLIDERAHDAAVAIAPLIYPSDPPQTAAAWIEAAAPYADPQARIDVADFLTQFAWFKAQGLLDASAEPGKAMDLSFIPSHLNAAR
jgi:NitT/TauT family transport system substrate-binding protein